MDEDQLYADAREGRLRKLLPGLSDELYDRLGQNGYIVRLLNALITADPETLQATLVEEATKLAEPVDYPQLDILRSLARRPSEELTRGSDPDEQKLVFFLTEVRSALDAQWDQWKHADTRVQFFLGWTLTSVSVSVALGVGKSPGAIPRVFFTVAAALAVWAVVLVVRGYLARGFLRPPDPAGFLDDYFEGSPIDARLMLIGTVSAAYIVNRDRLDERQLLLARAIITVGAAGIVAIFGLGAAAAGLGG